jgi:hypothetical protein
MKNTLTLLSLALFFFSCSKDDNTKSVKEPQKTNTEYLTFGHYYGMCLGEGCVEIFKLTTTELLEDQNDHYPHTKQFYVGNYAALDENKFNLVKNLMDDFPSELLQTDTLSFGCPDCADQGGLYIEYFFNNKRRMWTIDQAKRNVPAYLHVFMDKVNEKITLINT